MNNWSLLPFQSAYTHFINKLSTFIPCLFFGEIIMLIEVRIPQVCLKHLIQYIIIALKSPVSLKTTDVKS